MLSALLLTLLLAHHTLAIPVPSSTSYEALEARDYDTKAIKDSWFKCVPNERNGFLDKLTIKKESCFVPSSMVGPRWMWVHKEIFITTWKRKGPRVAFQLAGAKNLPGYQEWAGQSESSGDAPPAYSVVDPLKIKSIKGAGSGRKAAKQGAKKR